ncbi:hypothetical protein [Desulfogranum japonicum]|uniref:hypothetical protein n=1 Tax=Desulfogranum japonicum TaxID=231447 RepID=UPI0003FA00C8|nr:hypothetical protein [Desulfogranum japonicum]
MLINLQITIGFTSNNHKLLLAFKPRCNNSEYNVFQWKTFEVVSGKNISTSFTLDSLVAKMCYEDVQEGKIINCSDSIEKGQSVTFKDITSISAQFTKPMSDSTIPSNQFGVHNESSKKGLYLEWFSGGSERNMICRSISKLYNGTTCCLEIEQKIYLSIGTQSDLPIIIPTKNIENSRASFTEWKGISLNPSQQQLNITALLDPTTNKPYFQKK